MIIILDEIVLRSAMRRAEAATKQQVYVITGASLDGQGCIAKMNVQLDSLESSAMVHVDIA